MSALAARGSKVTAVQRPGGRSIASNNVDVLELDLLSASAGDRLLETIDRVPGNVEIVHLAALSDTAEIGARPIFAVDTNITLTARLLLLARRRGASRFLLASSGAVYRSRSANSGISEEDEVQATSIYTATKIAAEALCHGAAREWGIDCEIVRISNVYGPDSPENTVFGRLLAQARRGVPLQVKTCKPIRDFIYIDDVVDGLARVLYAPRESGCVTTNLSTGTGTSIGALVEATAVAARVPVAEQDEHRDADRDALVLANERLYQRTGWRPAFTLTKGLNAIFTKGEE